MNKVELVDRVREYVDIDKKITKKEMTEIVDNVFEVIMDSIVSGEDVLIHGFGKFVCRTRASRIGVNPATQEKIQIDESKYPAFKPGTLFKERVSNK